MDCAAFEKVVLDLVYDDGSLERRKREEAEAHVATCEACGPLLATMTKARKLAAVPPLDVPSELEAKILRATIDRRELGASASWMRRLDRAVSFAGAYAMRPQLAMGALLLLMVGTSLFLLRARPAGPGAVRITEIGVPAEAQPTTAATASTLPADRRAAPDAHAKRDDNRVTAKETYGPRAAAEAPAAPAAPAATAPTSTSVDPSASEAPAASAPPQDAAFAAAMDDFKAKRWSDAVRGFDIVANGGGANAGTAALFAARATRFSSGCGAALPRFDSVATRFAATSVAAEASFDSATCYREVGQIDRARQLFQSLRRVAGYRDRAEKELATLDKAPEQAGEGASKAATPAPAKLAPGSKADAKPSDAY